MPTQPSGPKNTQTTGTGTKTGDPTNAALPAVAGGIALAGLIIIKSDHPAVYGSGIFLCAKGDAIGALRCSISPHIEDNALCEKLIDQLRKTSI